MSTTSKSKTRIRTLYAANNIIILQQYEVQHGFHCYFPKPARINTPSAGVRLFLTRGIIKLPKTGGATIGVPLWERLCAVSPLNDVLSSVRLPIGPPPLIVRQGQLHIGRSTTSSIFVSNQLGLHMQAPKPQTLTKLNKLCANLGKQTEERALI